MQKPNLVFVIADQLRYQSLGYAGDPRAQTPVLDALSKRSVNLKNAVSGHPVCAPFRASLFTGKYTTSTGMVVNEVRLNTAHETFARTLTDGGYNTSYIGKWHLYADELGNHYDPKNSFIPRGPDRLGFDGDFAAYNFHHDFYGETAYYHLESPEKVYCDGFEPDVQTDMAITQMTALSQREEPFALFLSVGTPHDPWVPENVPPEWLAKFRDTEFTLPGNYRPENDPYADNWARFHGNERDELTEWQRVYYAMTANLDWNVGRLLDAMDGLGIADDTIFVFTSDHGEMFGAHGRRAKNIFYEEAVRVPFLVRHGELTPATVDCCLNTVDIMPTMLTLMGLPVPATVQGEDFSAVLRLSKEAQSAPVHNKGALMMCTGPTAAFNDGMEWRAYRDQKYTYAVYRRDGRQFLFDHVNDPLQLVNLIESPAHQAVAARLKARMYTEMADIGDNFAPNSYYREHWLEDRKIKAVLV